MSRSPWAFGASATSSEPSSQLFENGFTSQDPPTSESVNYVLGMGVRAFEGISEAIRKTSPGQSFYLHPPLNAPSSGVYGIPDISLTGVTEALSATTLTSLVTDGKYVYCLRGTTALEAYDADTLDLAMTLSPVTALANIRGLRAQGIYLLILHASGVELYNTFTNASEWTYTGHGAAIADACIMNSRVLAVGAVGSGSNDVRSLDQGTGSLSASYAHGGQVAGVVPVRSNLAVIVGATSGSDSKEIRGLSSTGGVLWSADNDPVYTGALGEIMVVTDGSWVYYLSYDTSDYKVKKINPADGSEAATVTLSGAPLCISVDQSLVWVSLADNTFDVYRKADLTLVGNFGSDARFGVTNGSHYIAVDGATPQLVQWYRGAYSRPTHFVRISASGSAPKWSYPYGWLAIPAE